MSKRRVGGYEFKAELSNIRLSVTAIRRELQQVIELPTISQATALHIARAAIELTKITDATKNIEEIGEDARSERT